MSIEELSKEIAFLKLQLADVQKNQEIKVSTFGFEMINIKDRINSLILDMRQKNDEFNDKFESHLRSEEKHQVQLHSNFEKFTNKIEAINEAVLSNRERQNYFKEELSSLSAEVTNARTTLDKMKKEQQERSEKNMGFLDGRISKLEKIYYTGIGIVLVSTTILDFFMDKLK